MKKIVYAFAFIFFLIISFNASAQVIYVDGYSEARKFVGQQEKFSFFRDWSFQAEFTSGIGEYVRFFPVELKNLQTGEKLNALQLEMLIKEEKNSSTQKHLLVGLKAGEIKSTAYLSLLEVDAFINFLEKSVTPNMSLSFSKKSSEFVFKSKEMVFKYQIIEKDKRIVISIPEIDPDTQKSNGAFLYFWTERNVDDIPQLIKTLKTIRSYK
jgi:hypothetical protein